MLFAEEKLNQRYLDNQVAIMENQRRMLNAMGLDAVIPPGPANISSVLTTPSKAPTARSRWRSWGALFFARSAAALARRLLTNWRMKNMKKWFRPDVLTIIAGALVTGANQLLGLDIDPTNIVAAAVLLLGYFKAHEYVTVVRDANGLPTGYKLNSRKLIFTAIAFAFVVLDAIYKLGASIESIVALTTIITGYNWTEAKKDVKTAEAEGADARQAH